MTKEFADDSHELVDKRDIQNVKPWTSTFSIQVNITKDPVERQSVATLQFTESDIDVLYQALVKGRENQSQTLEAVRRENEFLEDALDKIKRLALLAQIKDKNDSFAKIVGITKDALGEE